MLRNGWSAWTGMGGRHGPESARRLFFVSSGELKLMKEWLSVPESKVAFVENGVSPIFDTEIASGEYVLSVGRIQPLKNQLNLAIACRRAGLQLKYVGQVIDHEYAHKVLSVWGELLSNRPQCELVPLYRSAKVVACVSQHEVQPNCVLEGGLAGANIVLTERSCSFTDGYPNIWVCKTDSESIAEAISAAWSNPKNAELKRVFRNWTWERTARKLLDQYNTVV